MEHDSLWRPRHSKKQMINTRWSLEEAVIGQAEAMLFLSTYLCVQP